MPEREAFLARATLCVSMAAVIDDGGYKAALLEMAQQWRELAVRATHRDTEPLPIETVQARNS